MKPMFRITPIELVALTLLALVVGTIGFDRYQALDAIHRDQERKIALNTIHYNLQEIVRPEKGGYPRTLKASDLSAMEPGKLRDPAGVTIGNRDSDYRYEPSGCNGGELCRSYTLRSKLELSLIHI